MANESIDFGMYSFVQDGSPIYAIFKQRYSDFIVHEISPNGDMVRLTDTSAACEANCETEPVEIVDNLETLISNEKLEEMEDLLSGQREEVLNLTKESRTEVHKAIRVRFADVFETTTLNNDGQSFIRVMKTEIACKGKRKRKQWPSERGDYLHFALFKENKDSHQAVSILSSLLGKNPHDIKIAGTKDKRAVTTQKVSMYRMEAPVLARLNFKLKGMRVGNFSYEKEDLHLGQTQGNFFEIVLRDIQGISREKLIERVETWKNCGFINYYGSQRFGTTSVPTWEVGRAIVKEDWRGAVDSILKCRKGGDVDLIDCYSVWETSHDAELSLKAAKGKAKKHSIECILLKALIKHGPNNYYNAMNALPRNTRSLYVHSYQSIIWNKIVSKRVDKFGLKVIKGDMIVDKLNGDLRNILVSEIDEIDLNDIVLPLPSSHMIMPQNQLAEWYVELMEKDGVTLGHLDSVANDYASHGATRPVFMKPIDCDYELINYLDETKPLMQTDLDKLKGKFDSGAVSDNTNDAKLALKLGFRLTSGCYATMALRELTKYDMSKQNQCALQNSIPKC